MFIQAKPGTKFHTINNTNMDEFSFGGDVASLERTIQQPNQAFFGRLSETSHYHCKVNKGFEFYYGLLQAREY